MWLLVESNGVVIEFERIGRIEGLPFGESDMSECENDERIGCVLWIIGGWINDCFSLIFV